MRRLLVLLLFGLTASVTQVAPQSPVTLTWKHVSARYKSLNEITPVLVNEGKQSVFLSRIWPDGSAQLERFNESTGKWESGEWGVRCGTVQQPDVPIEIPSKAERSVDVYWQLSTDDWDNPTHFVVRTPTENRPLEGKYRFMLRYALMPWTVFRHPKAVYTIVSPEFLVAG
jgi:hypothetical protein